MTRTTKEQLDSKVDYFNRTNFTRNKLSLESRNGTTVLCLFNGSRDLARGTKAEIWQVLDVIETVLYFEQRAALPKNR